MEKLEDYRSYQQNYSESKLWNKISSVAHKAGAKVVPFQIYSKLKSLFF